ncbi:fluoride efflux transporter FluC [Thermoactinospora rubra]|uniref:fluoride efflux transporter FluC n=1 Tax=Thermoactinospora rubra TaxID=1088767 RepID=UPI000A10BF93|nr:CrcB family protein [Thermoactinospora rubra]
MTVLLVALGAAVGAPLRYVLDRLVQSLVRSRHCTAFPWGTLVVNVAGSALLGFLTALPASGAVMALAGSGFCGALTTYSAFGYETVRLAEAGARLHAVLNAVVSVAAGLLAALAGMALAGAVS